jgi:hypothetical protein
MIKEIVNELVWLNYPAFRGAGDVQGPLRHLLSLELLIFASPI